MTKELETTETPEATEPENVNEGIEINDEYIEQAAAERDAEEKVEIPEGNLGTPGEGYEHVTMDEPTQAKFNNMYRQMKRQERVEREMGDDLKSLQEHNQKLEGRLNSIDKEKNETTFTNKQTALQYQISQANETGDYEAAAQLTSQLVDSATENAIKKQEPSAPAPTEQAQPQSGLDNNQQDFIVNWQDETAENGDALRPWAQKGHEYFEYTKSMIASIASHPDYAKATIEQIMAQADKVMGLGSEPVINTAQGQPQRAPAVSTSDTSYRPESNKTGVNSLNEDQKRVARLTMPDVAPQEAYKRYAAQL